MKLIMERYTTNGRVKCKYFVVDQKCLQALAPYTKETITMVAKGGRGKQGDDMLNVKHWEIVGTIHNGIVLPDGRPLSNYPLN
jgi:hypothetical protein